ncbi:MAG TPA: hypothetical protein VFI23_10095 [Rhizomicrobium sp.]|nr:hypothetical protein [Rhizomicrobium sp.]
MDTVTDIAWTVEGRAAEPEIAAAKLHVLHLDPIKDKLGDKWSKLSGLVHKLFEKALRNVQGPSDHFLLVDEMSYVVTFNTLSLEAASLACASVAREVCELLFGAEADDIAVRGLVGLVPKSSVKTMAGGAIAELLERRGGEFIVRPAESHVASHEVRSTKIAPPPVSVPGGWIHHAESLFAKSGTALALFPVWDLKSRKSASLHMAGYSPSAEKAPCSMRRLFKQAHDAHFVEHEIAVLQAAAEYAQRVHRAGKVCAVGLGVSYETLSGLHARIAYIGALKSVVTIPSCPILLRIERVPGGTPHGRIAEIVNMLSIPNIKPTVEFLEPRDLANLDIRLGAAGIGWSITNEDTASVKLAVHRLVQRAATQKAFSFVQGLKNDELAAAAQESGIRFGAGSVLGAPLLLNASDPVPNFPLGN